ncbi:MAG: hypothetical protein PHE24_05935 [Patescibacteria group bacterium]|nr:hypothetical protein [Patescibacteria group bacterium]
MTEQKQSFNDLDAVKKLVEALEQFNNEERTRIIRWACERLGMNNISNVKEIVSPLNVPKATNQTQPEQSTSDRKQIDIKSFVSGKNPTSDAQFVAVVAYYFKFEAPDDQRKEFIISDDLNEAARLADWARFVKPANTLNNVYNQSGYLNKVEHGKYKLNAVGENLVAMVLPGNGDGKVVKKKKRNSIVKKSNKKKGKK